MLFKMYNILSIFLHPACINFDISMFRFFKLYFLSDAFVLNDGKIRHSCNQSKNISVNPKTLDKWIFVLSLIFKTEEPNKTIFRLLSINVSSWYETIHYCQISSTFKSSQIIYYKVNNIIIFFVNIWQDRAETRDIWHDQRRKDTTVVTKGYICPREGCDLMGLHHLDVDTYLLVQS